VNYFIALLSMALAALVAAQSGPDNGPLMFDYKGLTLVYVGLAIIALSALLAEMNNQAAGPHNR
jgi:hypothetical protein